MDDQLPEGWELKRYSTSAVAFLTFEDSAIIQGEQAELLASLLAKHLQETSDAVD